MDKLVVTIKPTIQTTRVLMTCGDDEVCKAILPPPSTAHRYAAPTLLEALSLWYGRRISVVLCAAGEDSACVLNLSDRLGFGHQTMHYDVEVVAPGRRRGRRIAGVGTFRDLRQMSLRGVG